MDALNETIERLEKGGMSEEEAVALVARLLHEEAVGFLWCLEKILDRDQESEAHYLS